MALALMPDVEAVIGDYLRDLDEVGAQVVGHQPSKTTEPWIRLTVIDARTLTGSTTEYAYDCYVQLDCFAGSGGQEEASLLARRARAALASLTEPGTVLEGVTVNGVAFTTFARQPDTAFEPAKERYVVAAEISLHR
jgi:hypothetical protein